MESQLASSSNLLLHTQNNYYDTISKICYPLFKKTPIQYFDYTRFYDSGEMVTIGTHPHFTVKFYEHGQYPSFEEFQVFSSSGMTISLLSHNMPLPLGAHDVNPDRYLANIASAWDAQIFHRLYFMVRREGFYLTCGFGIKQEMKLAHDFFLNSLSILEDFIKYFEHHARDLITENAQNNRINLPLYHNKLLPYDMHHDVIEHISNIDFSINPITRNSQINTKLFTSREIDCLNLIAQGYTMKNAARRLAISPRTVETHLRNIKEKHAINTKNQLIDLWHTIKDFQKS